MPNLLDPVTRHAAASDAAVALRTDEDPWTYAGLREASLRYAGALRDAGVSVGERVLLVAPSIPEFVVAYMGIQALGGVVVPVNTMSTAVEVEYYLTDSGAALAIGWHALGPAVAEAAAAVGVPHWTLYADARVDATPLPDAVDRDRRETAAILYTSGTTGRPKGAELTVGNLLSGGEIGCHLSRGTAEDRTGTGLPLFHIFGQAAVMMATFTGGGSLSLLGRFTAAGMIDILRRDDLTIMCGVPTMWNAMLHAARDDADFTHLRVAISGGASLPGEIARAFESRFGCTILEGYGLTETTAVGTFNDVERGRKIGSTGGVVPRLEVEVRDTAGNSCPPGTIGEVYIKGETVMKGYWNHPDATAAAITPDGWFRTGDLGEFDADRDLRIAGRIKDLIIRGGYNVYPGEVEEVLYQHPDIVEAAVVGVPDDYYGEEVAAVITRVPGSALTEDEVVAWSREKLSAYKIPRIVRFVDQLPKGSTGKILKRDIDRTDLRKASA
ncbi:MULTISPECIES: AMP-binding protein [unclassified Rhodococcus (in: high G+C Gram-positive bacteria)]|uniref:AMP-binding protein n=1 Tax=unclassified Rhodococcus (in: high G+C Gram-positive bacteria) TaxID=192944 RepID=UPI00096A86ED|nr:MULTISPECIES: AMP-binding protein [unclassified Rhodococcus (in: high G+C Gram-positive bacteria)]